MSYWARSLKASKPSNYRDIAPHLPRAMPGASDYVLDAEVLVVRYRPRHPGAWGDSL